MTYTAAGSSGGSSAAGVIFPLLLIGLLALLFFSQRRRSRAVQNVQRHLQPGMNVMTTAGLYAEIQAVDDDQVHLEIAPGIVCRYARAAVARVLDPPDSVPMEIEDGNFDDASPDDGILGGGGTGRGADRGPQDGPPPAAPAT
jgi:preprotein translocase subunit YajC